MNWLEKEFPKTNKNIDDMTGIVEKYDFEYKEGLVYGSYAEAIFEYIGEDMIYRTEEEYVDYAVKNNLSYKMEVQDEWECFCDEQKKIVIKNFRKALKEVDEKEIKYREYESDGSDYPCVIVTFDLE